MSTHWTQEEYKACESAKTFKDLLVIALQILERMKKLGKPIVEVCGPMTTGGRGSAEENFRLYNFAVKSLEDTGKIVFNPTPFQETMGRLSTHLQGGEYNMDILEVFYRGLFSSGYIDTVYFLPGWQTSKGASWERKNIAGFGVKIEEYPADLLQDFK